MLTIGHSTLPIDVFLGALQENDVQLLIDVRTIPRSRYNPQFDTEELAGAVRESGIEYRWMQTLGGLRHSREDSINTGWRNTSFRGYADYMQTDAFAQALVELMEIDQQTRVVIICAEAVPWRCHRSLIGDALLVHHHPVEDIFVTPAGVTHRKPHEMTSFARVEGSRLWYPAPDVDGQGKLPFPDKKSKQSREALTRTKRIS